MKYGSVCSGIEAASVAWHHLGWEARWFSEIEHFPSEVLKYRFPAVENLGDMTKLTNNETFKASTIDLLVGGTPCQSFSVAGLRGGLADPRGNLMLTFLSLADAKKPRWIVWENVPGVLSSNGGKDFSTFLGALGELGYGFAYRVLDAQHFGVAQRRRRVFVVGYLGDWRVAAAVLFERESLQRDIKPSRKKRQEVTPDAEGSVGAAGEISCAGGNLSPTVTSKWMKGYGGPSGSNETGNMVYAPTIIDRAAFNQGENAQYEPRIEEGETMSSLVATGPHAVAQPIPVTITFNDANGTRADRPNGGLYITEEPQCTSALTCADNDTKVMQPIAYSFDGLSSNSMKSSNPDSGCRAVDVAKTLDTTTPEPSKNQGGIAIVQPFRKVRRAQSDSDFETWEKDETANTLNCFDVGDVRSTNVVAQPIAVDWRTAQVDQGITQTLKTDLAKMSGPCVAVDTYNQTINERTSQTIGSSASDVNHYGAVMHSIDFRKSFYEIKKDVLVRKYPVDIDSLKRCLKKHKKISNNKISELLNLPKTKIDHWFRQDDSFAIPSPEHWFQLKEILHIETNIFDQSITEFIIEENKYDSTNRIYDSTFPSPTLTASNSGSDNYITPMAMQAAGFLPTQGSAAKGIGYEIEQAPTLRAGCDNYGLHHPPMAIRRLTPKECERLQGFPDDWTLIPYRNKPADQCPDGPRYKACGNSMAVPVMRWIGERIQLIDTIIN